MPRHYGALGIDVEEGDTFNMKIATGRAVLKFMGGNVFRSNINIYTDWLVTSGPPALLDG